MGKNTTIKNLAISKASEVLVSTTKNSTTKPPTLAERFNLTAFQAIEDNMASQADRSPLTVEFSDSINWPFRTKSFEEGTTIIQVSFNWLKQVDHDKVLDHFKGYCANGHVVTDGIQKAFDSTFARPSFLYTCGCGVQFTTSYVMRKEASQKKCGKCGNLVSTMTVTKQ